MKLLQGDFLKVAEQIEDASVDLVVTSPPYYNARPEYSTFADYRQYLAFMESTLHTLSTKLKPNGRLALNIPDGYGRNPWTPLYADLCNITRLCFTLRGSIVWDKGNGGGKTSWGSWRSSSNPCLIDEHEMVIVAHKEDPTIKGSPIERDEFLSLIHSVWHIKPATSRKGHPAPFPLELPTRLIKLLSAEGAVVLDPFMGSGTTGMACLNTKRDFIGVELNTDYFTLAEKNITRLL